LERNVLVHQIESRLYRGKESVDQLTRTCCSAIGACATDHQDPYNFEFLTLADEARELNLSEPDRSCRDFLLELGTVLLSWQ